MNTPSARQPHDLPSFVHKDDHQLIRDWISTRPAHEYDQCVNHMSRWVWTYIDQGIWSDISVKDAVVPDDDGSCFRIPVDFSNF
jgi:hypothetical protein